MFEVTFVLLGATGDVARRALIPALYQLFASKKLTKFALIGGALPDISVNEMLEGAQEFIHALDPDTWSEFGDHSRYVQLDVTKEQDYVKLNDIIRQAEQEFSLSSNHSGNRVLYCSSSWEYYEAITRNSLQAGIIEHQDYPRFYWHRIAYEKPFGKDRVSAQAIYQAIEQMLNEKQVFLIDFFTAKGTVSNAVTVRFENPFFEPLWNNKHIERIEILLNETLGIEDRGKFYDTTGALRDIVQNHLLQLMSLVALPPMENLRGKNITDAKIQVLSNAEFVDGILGQYIGYRQESGVASDSMTETFAALRFNINTTQWENVPFFLQTGKYLHKQEVLARIVFKKPKVFPGMVGSAREPALTIQIAPHAGLDITILANEPDITRHILPTTLEFRYRDSRSFMINAYEVIFQDIFKGDHVVSVRFHEIDYAWKIIDAIKVINLRLYFYEKGSTGPHELQEPKSNIS